MSAPELKPCPFCGTKPTERNALGSYVFCHGCITEGPYSVAGNAVDMWNRRADLAPDAAKVAALVEAAQDLAREMEFMLRHNPDKDGGMYRDAVNAARAALAAWEGKR
jgi:hypothetical protein